MKQNYFFFYNNLKSEKLIDLIDKNYKIFDGSISIKEIDGLKNIIGKEDRIDGKLVCFENDLSLILSKINNMKYLSFENKLRYKIYIVKVYTSDYKTIDAYLIN